MLSHSIRKSTGRRFPTGARRAFTLIEMLLVLMILAILAAIVVPKFAGRTEQAKQTAASTEIRSFATALDAFEVDNGYYPSTADGLLPLLEEPSNVSSWRGPYLNKPSIPLDPWGKEYLYEYPGKNNTKGYDLASAGPDGEFGTADDITNY